MNCSKCGQPNDVDAEFCENCGNSLALTCTQCGTPLKPNTRFCKKCGTPVAGQPADRRATQGSRRATQGSRLATLQQSAPPELQEKLRSAARAMEGERKPVTILFTDIAGSTSLAEKLDPEEWKEIVNGAHQRVSQAVYNYEGTIAQLLGDGVLAFFGAPVTHEDDALRAVLAALDIQGAIAEYERQLAGFVDHFQMRIGVNSGTVVVGSVGSDLHLEYLAIGDAVNLAARLQSAAQPGKVLISESTAKLVQATFVLQPLGEIAVKGKTEPVAAFEVVGSKAALAERRGYAMLRSPLVGREAELGALQQALNQLNAGLGGVVSITGEAGIGKSRLVEEARQAAPETARWLEGRALSYGQKLSFWTIRQLLLNDLGLSDGDPEVRLRLALRKRTEALFGSEAGQVFPYLAQLLGVQLEGDLAERVKILDGETLRHQMLVSIARYFSRLAQEQPVVLALDDLHWADPSSLEALEHLLPLTDRVPILIVMLSRLEREHLAWKIKLKAESELAHRYTGIDLKPLPEDDQNRLVDSLLFRDALLLRDNLLAIADLPESVRQRILEHAEGNPLFLEEIVRHLVEQGAIVRAADTLRVSRDILNITIPDTLRGVLLARIDRLQEDVRHTLQLAAVIGKSFLYRLLEAIAEAETQLEGQLAQLQRADLVREKARLPELEYMFKHSLTQEAAYDSLLVANRKQFHLQVGQALEKLFAGRQEEYLGLLAHHFDAAGETDKATGYLIRAGDQARMSDELVEAAGYYQRAIDLLSEVGDTRGSAHAWLKLGLVYTANFEFEAAYQAYEQAFALTQKTKPSHPDYSPTRQHVLRMGGPLWDPDLDPGYATFLADAVVINWLFAGLAQVDNELNVVPSVARSWRVLDGGTRYLFHLRDDARWTDGTPVTAHDFEWAWKRNLHPSMDDKAAQYLFDVAGAQAYHQGENPNPESIGVRALDDLTLDVRLVRPVAYFPYVVTSPQSFPLPRATIERYGKEWWKPKNIVSNGAFRLVEFKPQTSLILERNPTYPNEFPGNVHRSEYRFFREDGEVLQAYLDDQIDILLPHGNVQFPDNIPEEEVDITRMISVWYAFLNPAQPPFEDVRVRQAFALSLDRMKLNALFGVEAATGGIVPPGMPGHSPDIGLTYNPVLARRYLAEAGFPDGKGLPVIKATIPMPASPEIQKMLSTIIQVWQSELGVDIDFSAGVKERVEDYPLVFLGWSADFPDPYNYLCQASHIHLLQQIEWQDDDYKKLVETAAHLPDRKQRMALYRQADRLFTVDRALVIPWGYATQTYGLVRPWVKNFHVNLLGTFQIHTVTMKDRPGQENTNPLTAG